MLTRPFDLAGYALTPYAWPPLIVGVMTAMLGIAVLVARVIWRYHLVDITPAFAANQIIHTLADALVVLDREGVVRVVNQAACELFRRSTTELVGKPVTALSHTFLTQQQLETLFHGGTIRDHELALLANADQGGIQILNVSASMMRDQTQQPAAIVCIARDVTEQKRAEEQLQQANVELGRREQELVSALSSLKQSHQELQTTQLQLIQAAKFESVGRLAAGVAHEVKNPLATLLLGVEHLTDHLAITDSDLTILLGDMNTAIRRADAVMRGLLDFSAPKQLELSDERLHELIDQSLVLVKHELAKRHIAVVRDFDPDLPLLKLDRIKIEQAFVNLLMNAMHAISHAGQITITTRLAQWTPWSAGQPHKPHSRFGVGDTVVVAEIEDTGEGIPEERLPKIFDPFFTTKPTGQGTGLGLTVTKNVIELHGGAIAIANRSAGGARATLTFPVKGGVHHGQEAHLSH